MASIIKISRGKYTLRKGSLLFGYKYLRLDKDDIWVSKNSEDFRRCIGNIFEVDRALYDLDK